VAVSEISQGHGKSRSTLKSAAKALAVLSLSVFSLGSSALDLPTGAQIAAGAATVQAPIKGALTVNQGSQRAVIKWSDFSIAQGNRVNFAQPNASAATLNVVTGNSASTIAGALTANGSVYLVNQNGIAITPTGLVDTRTGFIASTLSMSEKDFMKGNLLFSGKGGAVVNGGQILTGAGGAVVLLGSTVSNEGLIRAPMGKVALGSGESATLDLNGDGFLQVMLPVSALAAEGQALVNQKGVIQADGGVVVLKAATVREALRNAVNMPGEIRARSVSGQNGAIVLDGGAGGAVRVDGTLDAAADVGAASGGSIAITGEAVALQGANLLATGALRGGLVQVGGSFQGGREQTADSAGAALFAGRYGTPPVIANATTTFVDAASRIDVSATGDKGTGGTAIVWSNKTTDMQGSIAARGASSGGAVEISSAALVRSVALKRVDIGKGGTLLLDPQDIVIDTDTSAASAAAGDMNYAARPGTATHLLSADVNALLSAGTTVNLQASQDIRWVDYSSAFNPVPRSTTTPGGNLNLSAGRSVTLDGIFTMADGNWSIIANDTAAHGVIDAERGAGPADINLMDATFIGSNGKLSLTLADGAGNTNRSAGRIGLGFFRGNSLTAAIAPTSVADYGTPNILLRGDVDVFGGISLTGNLTASSNSGLVQLKGQTVTWTNEKTGGAINGEGQIKFIENGAMTRLGTLGYADAQRLALGDATVVGATRAYGDNEPGDLDLGTPQLHVAAHSPAAAQPIQLNTILAAGSLDVKGPGVTADVGQHTLTVSASKRVAFASRSGSITFDNGIRGDYFIDLTPSAPIPLTITPRLLKATLNAASYTFGSPVAVVSLAGVVNGDQIVPVATLNGAFNIQMDRLGKDYGFIPETAAGNQSFSLTGLADLRGALWGASPKNYTLSNPSVDSAVLNITPKPVNYVMRSSNAIGGVYGDVMGQMIGDVTGALLTSPVWTSVGYKQAGVWSVMTGSGNLPVGNYTTSVLALKGQNKDNYRLSISGNTDGSFAVTPRPVNFESMPNIKSTYGTLSSVMGLDKLVGPGAFDPEGNYYRKAGIRWGDDVQMNTSVTTYGGAPITLAENTPAGSYNINFSALSGFAARNYTFTPSGANLTINRKIVTYTGSNTSQEYGKAVKFNDLTLNGVLGTDKVDQSMTVESTAGSGFGTPSVGTYSFFPELYGPVSANYILSTTGSTKSQLTITPKPVTIEFAWTPNHSTYGTMAVLPQATVVGKLNNSADDTVGSITATAPSSGTVALTATTSAGTHTVGLLKELSGAGASNYKLVESSATFEHTVDPKVLSFDVKPVNGYSSIYGDALPAYKVNLGGVLSGDSVDAKTKLVDFTTNAVVIGRPSAGDYQVLASTLSGASAANYMLQGYGNTSQMSILQRPVSVTGISPASSVYGTLAVDGSVNFNNLLAGDSVSAKITYMGLGANGGFGVPTERTNAGSYIPYVFGITGNSNYVFQATGQTNFSPLTIAPKPIDFSTPNVSSFYGTRPVLGASTLLGGVLPGDDVRAGATVITNVVDANQWVLPNVGSYALSPKLEGQQARNYTPVSAGTSGGTLTISPAVISARLELYNEGKALSIQTYDQSNGALSPRYSSVYGSLAAPSVNADGTVDKTLEARASFYASSGNIVGSDSLGMAMKLQPTLPLSNSGNYAAGTFTWMPGVLTGKTSNYVLQAAGDASLTITPAPLVVAPKFQQAGVVLAENSAVYGFTGSISLDASAAGIKVSNGKQDSVAAPNLLGIKTGSSSAVSNLYLGASLGRLQAGSYTVTGNDGVPGGGLTGADSANYQARVVETGFLVKPKEVSIVAAEQRWTYGNLNSFGLNDPFVTNASVTGVLPGDKVNAVLRAYSDSGDSMNLMPRTNAGTYAINPVGISGENAGNYFFTPFGQASYLAANKSNVLTISKKSVLVTGDASNLAITYGDYVTKNMSIVKGVLAGDDVQVVPKANMRVPQDTAKIVKNLNGTLLGAGDYTAIGELSGGSSGNYFVGYSDGRNNLGEINVAKRALTLPLDANSPYGSSIPTEFRPGNLVPGDNLWVSYGVDELSGARSAIKNANGRYNVGQYVFNRKSIVIGSLTNYTLGDGLVFNVIPKELTWAPVANATATYGTLSAIPYATLSGVLSGDDGVQVSSNAYRPLADLRSDVFPPTNFFSEASIWSPVVTRPFVDLNFYYGRPDPRTYYFTDNPDRPKLNVGKNSIDISTNGVLTGVGSSNYRLAPSTAATIVTITPKPLTVENRQVQYGYYQACESQNCSPWGPPLNSNGYSNFNQAALQGAVKSDYTSGEVNPLILKATVEYLDANGKSIAIDSKTPVGRYTQVLTGLQGSNASNYMVGSTSMLDVIPMWLSYATSSAIYLNGVGLVGTPGIPSLRGPKGVPSINGDQVLPGTVIGIDPAGRRVSNLSNLIEGRYQFKVTSLVGKNAGNYRILPYENNDVFVNQPGVGKVRFSSNDVGTLDIFANTSFGMNHVGTTVVPVVPPLPPAMVPLPRSITDPRVAGTNTSATANKSGDAGGGSAQGTATSEASAEGTATFGPGSATGGVSGSAGGSASASRDGAEAKGGVSVDATTTIGVQGGVGNDTKGSINLDVKATAGVSTENEGTVRDGKLTVGTDSSAGASISLGTSGGVSSGAGSLDASVGTSVGLSAGFASGAVAGYNNDGLTLGATLSLKLLIGIDIKFEFTIDREKLEGAFSPVIEFFGGEAYKKPTPAELGSDELAAVNALRTDPYKRLSYLYTHDDWKNAPDSYYLKKATEDLENFTSLIKAYPDLKASQKETQEKMLLLLRTDPAAAIAMAHSDDFRSRYAEQELAIPRNAANLGLKFVVTNGAMSLANR